MFQYHFGRIRDKSTLHCMKFSLVTACTCTQIRLECREQLWENVQDSEQTIDEENVVIIIVNTSNLGVNKPLYIFVFLSAYQFIRSDCWCWFCDYFASILHAIAHLLYFRINSYCGTNRSSSPGYSCILTRRKVNLLLHFHQNYFPITKRFSLPPPSFTLFLLFLSYFSDKNNFYYEFSIFIHYLTCILSQANSSIQINQRKKQCYISSSAQIQIQTKCSRFETSKQ